MQTLFDENQYCLIGWSFFDFSIFFLFLNSLLLNNPNGKVNQNQSHFLTLFYIARNSFAEHTNELSKFSNLSDILERSIAIFKNSSWTRKVTEIIIEWRRSSEVSHSFRFSWQVFIKSFYQRKFYNQSMKKHMNMSLILSIAAGMIIFGVPLIVFATLLTIKSQFKHLSFCAILSMLIFCEL